MSESSFVIQAKDVWQSLVMSEQAGRAPGGGGALGKGENWERGGAGLCSRPEPTSNILALTWHLYSQTSPVPQAPLRTVISPLADGHKGKRKVKAAQTDLFSEVAPRLASQPASQQTLLLPLLLGAKTHS